MYRSTRSCTTIAEDTIGEIKEEEEALLQQEASGTSRIIKIEVPGFDNSPSPPTPGQSPISPPPATAGV